VGLSKAPHILRMFSDYLIWKPERIFPNATFRSNRSTCLSLPLILPENDKNYMPFVNLCCNVNSVVCTWSRSQVVENIIVEKHTRDGISELGLVGIRQYICISYSCYLELLTTIILYVAVITLLSFVKLMHLL